MYNVVGGNFIARSASITAVDIYSRLQKKWN